MASERKYPLLTVFCGRRSQAEQSGLPFEFNSPGDMVEQLGNPEGAECPACGVIMTFGGMAERRSSPSIDRFEPDRGYTAANTWWICHQCNTRKSNSNTDGLIRGLQRRIRDPRLLILRNDNLEAWIRLVSTVLIRSEESRL